MSQSDPSPDAEGPDPRGQNPPNRPPQHLSARVPESVSTGVFSTGIIVMTGGTEFIVDFIQNIGPASVNARVVMPHATMPQFIEALRKNLDMYSKRFGTPPELPRTPSDRTPTPQEIYDDLKMSDELLSGAFANGVMIGHTAAEFKFDFIANLFPHSSVSCRVFLSAPQIPRMLDSLNRTFLQFQQRVQQQQQQQEQQQTDQKNFPPGTESSDDPIPPDTRSETPDQEPPGEDPSA